MYIYTHMYVYIVAAQACFLVGVDKSNFSYGIG